MPSEFSGPSGWEMLAVEFERHGAMAGIRVAGASAFIGERLVQEVQRRAPYDASRQGEHYRDTIRAEQAVAGGVADLSVGSDAPQTMRLELGFVGIDAAGRHYNQAPQPHYGPAADALEPEIEEIIAVRVADLDTAAIGGL